MTVTNSVSARPTPTPTCDKEDLFEEKRAQKPQSLTHPRIGITISHLAIFHREINPRIR